MIEIQIKPSRQTAALQRMVRQEWPTRFARFQQQVPLVVARRVLRDLLENIPSKPEWATYRRALQVGKILGLSAGSSGYAVRANVRARAVRQVDAPRTVLYIRSRRRLRRVKPEVTILESYNPWTLDTLPFTPNRNDAHVVSRKASRKGVEKIAKARRKDRPQWAAALQKHGVRETKKDKRLKLPKHVKAQPDIAYEALRLEFGLGGMRPKAHWRPAVLYWKRGGLEAVLEEQKNLVFALTRPRFMSWRKWPHKVKGRLKMQDARSYVPFQNKLGI